MEESDKIVEESDKIVEVLDKVVEVPDRVVEVPDRVVEVSDKIVEISDEVVEVSDEVVEVPDRVVEVPDKVVEVLDKIVEESDEVVEKSDEVVEESGKVVEVSNKVVEESGKVVEESGKVVEESGKVVEESGKVVEESGKVVEVLDKITDSSDKIMELSGEVSDKITGSSDKIMELSDKITESSDKIVRESGFISDRIRNLYNQYRGQKITPSTKQIDLIHKFGAEVKENSGTFEAQKQIRFLIGSQPITFKQQNLLRSFPKHQIDTILKKDVVIEDVTRFELSRILNTLQNRHSLAPKVYNHPLLVDQSYEYGWQESPKCPDNKLYYLVFYDFLMVDIDGVLDMNSLTNKLASMRLTARLYKTYNGYHIFVTSRSIDHKSQEAKIIMNLLDCDLFYSAFAFLNGYKIRLNPKLRDDEYIAAEYIGVIGIEPEDSRLLGLLIVHDGYIMRHKK
ncbi:Hypothetical protein HVR_LOCUS303 [uncultured virus]|nr:Hypothetical protein HVR_LOCUS303 [uncultured virus]